MGAVIGGGVGIALGGGVDVAAGDDVDIHERFILLDDVLEMLMEPPTIPNLS